MESRPEPGEDYSADGANDRHGPEDIHGADNLDGPGDGGAADDFPSFRQLPRTPSGRVPQWMIDEALGVPSRHTSSWRVDERTAVNAGQFAATSPGLLPPPAKRRRSWWGVIGALFFVALIGGMTMWTMATRGTGPASVADSESVTLGDPVVSWTTYTAGPTPGVGSEPEPIGTPPILAEKSDSYALISESIDDENSLVTAYDPCRPIHYVVYKHTYPQRADDLLADAIAEVSAATGLEFIHDGDTTETPSDTREPFQPDRYGDRWAPVLIAWTTPGEVPELAGSVAGRGGSLAIRAGNKSPVYVTGKVELDGPQMAEILRLDDGSDIAQAVIQHELGHVLGLDHVDDPGELMYPVTQPGVIDFGPGDRTGLALLGAGRCAPEL